MNRNEESSLPGITSMPSISRHVIEDLVANDNAPQMIDNTTPIRPSLRARSVTRSGTHQQHVTERRRIVTPDATDAAQQLIRFQIATATAEHELRTEGIHIDNAETELRSERLAIARLKLDTERAELETRKAELEARKAVAAATLASSGQRLHDLSRTTPTPPTSPKSSHSTPVSPCSAPSPPRVRSTSPTAEFTTILQMFERRDDQRREDQRREDEQRREDRRREDDQRRIDEQRREDQRREERCEDRRAAAEREARLEARLANAHHGAPPPPRTVTSDPGFKSNKAFDVVPLYSGANGEPLRPWSDEFLAQAEIVGDAHDNLRELRLKLRDPARAYFNRRYPATDPGTPPVLEAMAYLCSEFGPKYEESHIFAAYYRLLPKRGISGAAIKRALTAARERMRAAGIPAVRDEAEDQYYILELCLTAAQRTLFLSQLSARPEGSDAYLKSLTGVADEARRGSFAPALTSSTERAQLFQFRLTCIEAFLQMETGDDGHPGPARAATTAGLPDAPAASPADGDRAAVVLRLQAQHTARAADTEKPPPRYYGTATHPDLQRNATTFAERKASGACFGCTPAQLAAQGAIPHWQCKHHGQDASDADRHNRVAGSGPQRLSDGPGGRTSRR